LLTILILLEGESKIVERADGASALVGVAAGVLGVGEGAGLARRQGDAQAVVVLVEGVVTVAAAGDREPVASFEL
jgi:hypothetical protein